MFEDRLGVFGQSQQGSFANQTLSASTVVVRQGIPVKQSWAHGNLMREVAHVLGHIRATAPKIDEIAPLSADIVLLGRALA